MAKFSFDELLTLDGACFIGKMPEQESFSVSTDSRNLLPGDLYLALKGERFDGHQFVVSALKNDLISLAIVERQRAEELEAELGDLLQTKGLISVPDTLAAYQGLAQLHRRKANVRVIGITGSSGKTTTKEMTACVLSKKKVHKSKANENNEIGVPKTILNMPEDTEVLILEMGMRGLGQIAELASCGMPDIGIITCAGTTHIELLGSKENIARAKSELFEFLDEEQGLAIVGAPEAHLMEAVGRAYHGRVLSYEPVTIVSADVSGTTFKMAGKKVAQDDVAFTVRAHGNALIQDAWCALQAGLACGLTPQEAALGLAGFAPVEGRGNASKIACGAVVVDESYNANPDSVRCAVEAILSDAYPQIEKIVVLGEMAELGDFTLPLHRELGAWLKSKPLSMLVTVGNVAGEIAQGAEGAGYTVTAVNEQAEALDLITEKISDKSCIMVKGSHCTNLDRLVRELHNLS